MLTAKERFEESYMPIPETGCWIWMKHNRKSKRNKNKEEYGSFFLNGKHELAHRAAYKLYCGVIPINTQVLHKCDTPECVNPKHLFLGTQLDNVRDMEAKGRANHNNSPKGEKHKMSKLTTVKTNNTGSTRNTRLSWEWSGDSKQI